eukprot:scaffold57751_cov63-Phaeocystis_antarctica.AAC.4
MRCGARYTGRGAAGGGRPRRTQRAGEGATAGWGQGTWGRAHVEHVAHVRDAGGVEAQRLVERRRVLPRVERRACGAGQGIYGSGGSRRWTTAAHAACRRELDCRLGAGHGEERTENM